MVEHNGFYRSVDQAWVKLERIQFVGACNPPTDPGRKPLSHRYITFVILAYCLGTHQLELHFAVFHAVCIISQCWKRRMTNITEKILSDQELSC